MKLGHFSRWQPSSCLERSELTTGESWIISTYVHSFHVNGVPQVLSKLVWSCWVRDPRETHLDSGRQPNCGFLQYFHKPSHGWYCNQRPIWSSTLYFTISQGSSFCNNKNLVAINLNLHWDIFFLKVSERWGPFLGPTFLGPKCHNQHWHFHLYSIKPFHTHGLLIT